MTSEKFIGETLRFEGQYIMAHQTSEISRVTNRVSGHLLNGRDYSVQGSILSFIYPDYERFLDMKLPGRKRRRIHNRFTFGAYAAIAEKILGGTRRMAVETLNGNK